MKVKEGDESPIPPRVASSRDAVWTRWFRTPIAICIVVNAAGLDAQDAAKGKTVQGQTKPVKEADVQSKPELRALRAEYSTLRHEIGEILRAMDGYRLGKTKKEEGKEIKNRIPQRFQELFKGHRSIFEESARSVSTQLEQIFRAERGIKTGKIESVSGVRTRFQTELNRLRAGEDLLPELRAARSDVGTMKNAVLEQLENLKDYPDLGISSWKDELPELRRVIDKETDARIESRKDAETDFKKGGDPTPIRKTLDRILGHMTEKEKESDEGLEDLHANVKKAERFMRRPTVSLLAARSVIPTRVDLENLIAFFALREGEEVDFGTLTSWRRARLRRAATEWRESAHSTVQKLRRDHRDKVESFNGKAHYLRIKGDLDYIEAEKYRERYKQMVTAITESIKPPKKDAQKDTKDVRELRECLVALNDLVEMPVEDLPKTNVRGFPEGWTDKMREAWPDEYGTPKQMMLIESFDGTYWTLKDRPFDMVLIDPRDRLFHEDTAEPKNAGNAPFLIDKHEVTTKEFRTRWKTMKSKSFPLANWWKRNEKYFEKDDEFVFGISFEAARDFAESAYGNYQLRLPTSRQWGLAFRKVVKMVGAPKPLPSEHQSSEFLKPPKVAPEQKTAIWGIFTGLSEWCYADWADKKHVIRGASSFKPWTDVDGGIDAWKSATYFKDRWYDKKHEVAHPPNFRAPAFGFRCVYVLEEDK